ncbi:MAG: ParA family protein [Candidatus Lokiarchaeia archaeon]
MLSVSDYIVIPVKAADFSLKGIGVMIDYIRKVKEAINPELSILGILITQYDKRLLISKSIIKEIENKNRNTALFKTKIRRNTVIENSQYDNKQFLNMIVKV